MVRLLLIGAITLVLLPAGVVAAPRSAGLNRSVDLGPGFVGWSLELIPGPERRGVAHHRIRVRDGAGSTRQVLRYRSDLGSPTWLLNPLLEDLDFDGYLDLAVVREFGAKWRRYQVWRFDPHRRRFAETPLTRALGTLTNLETDHARRELLSYSIGPADPWTRRYRVVAGGLRPISER